MEIDAVKSNCSAIASEEKDLKYSKEELRNIKIFNYDSDLISEE